MKKHITLMTALLACLTVAVYGQITGIVKDASGTPIQDVSIFLNRTSIAATSQASGGYSLSGISPGFGELIAYKKGYQTFKAPIRIQAGHAVRVPLTLVADAVAPVSEKQKNSRERTASLKELSTLLLGNGPDVQFCKIINEETILFTKTGESTTLSADGPLIITNPSTGYKIYFYTTIAQIALKDITSSMTFRFDTLVAGDAAQQKEWSDSRENLFFGSRRHLFSSLVNGQTEVQGFRFLDEKNNEVDPAALTTPLPMDGYKSLKLSGKTKVIYDPRGNEPHISWIATTGDCTIGRDGMVLNEKTVLTEGAMNISGIATSLPLNFYPAASIRLRSQFAEIIDLFQEKVYIQTDKPYYYPGETVWLKGWMNYADADMRDSLSTVLYVELIGPAKNIVATYLLKIESGMTFGDFHLADALAQGNYQLRAYTNLMRNFGTDDIFSKAISILAPTDAVSPDDGKAMAMTTPGLSVSTDKKVYKKREEVVLDITIEDEENQPVYTNLSVSVTDAIQVVPVRETVSITGEFPFRTDQKKSTKALRYPVERGVGFSGVFSNNGKPQQTLLTMLQGGFGSMFIVNTNSDGTFRQGNYDFYDSMSFFFEAKNDKGLPYGKVDILPREIVPVADPSLINPFHVVPTTQRQRRESGFETPTQVLAAVDVTAKKLQASEVITQRFGNPSRIFRGDLFTGNDMIEALVTVIPSLKIFGGARRTLTFVTPGISRTQSLGITRISPEPLIYLNGAYVGGGPQSAVTPLTFLNPKNVEHVEVIYPNPPVFRVQWEGGTGLIAIFMKPDPSIKGFQTVKIPGYQKPHTFLSPAYDGSQTSTGPDYRSTLYWNPNVSVNGTEKAGKISFFTSDLPGKYHVVAEGVTEKGEPVRSEFYFEVTE